MLRFGIIILLGSLLNCTAIAHGDVHTRIDIVSDEIAEDANNPLLYVKRASLYLEDGDIKNTGNDLKKAQKLGGKNFPPSLMGYAKMYYKLGNHTTALKYINSFLQSDPDHVRGLLTKARILESSNDMNGAIENYRLVVAKTSTPLPENYFRLINALENTERTTEAVFYCEEAMRDLGELIVFKQKIIDLHLKANNYNAAIQQLDDILEGQQRKESLLYQKAMIYMNLGEEVKATEQLNLAMKSIHQLPKHIQRTSAMKTLTTKIEDQRNKAKPIIDDPDITGQVYTE